ncbi:MAG: hypothetical protein JSW53_03465 [Candidatus Bathyarchaeota archaeon]|nr:MAG: hypothetical protein JSW53_03465 [Candidatus Bathyarchaeota archaeon]
MTAMSTVSDEEEESEDLEEVSYRNAEQVTFIAKSFLEKLGHKRSLKPRKVSREGENYVVEVELKKKTATVKVNATTEEIEEYEIEAVTEESSLLPFSIKSVALTSIIVLIFLVVFNLLDLQSFLTGLL